MGTTLNKEAYSGLIKHDIKFLLAHIRPDALELIHVIDILNQSIQLNYPEQQTSQSTEVMSAEQVLKNHHIYGNLNQHGLTSVVKSAMGDYAEQFKQPLIRTDNSKVIDTLQKQLEEFKQRAETAEQEVSQLRSNFKAFIEQSGLSENDKNLVKGVFYDFLERSKK